MKNILIPSDCSATALAAMRAAIRIGQKLHAKLYFIHVIKNASVPAMAPPDLKIELNEHRKKRNQGVLESQIRKLYAELRVRAKEVPYECTIASRPLDLAIARYASLLKIDLIIMGTSGASGFRKIITGSNTSKIIKRSEISVLVIPTDYIYTEVKKIAMAMNIQEFEHKKSIALLNAFLYAYNAELEYFYILPKDDSFLKAHSKLMEIAAGLPIIKNEVGVHIKESEPIAETLENWLQEHDCDLVAMLPREWTIGKIIFSTSMTQEMAHRANLPLLILQ